MTHISSFTSRQTLQSGSGLLICGAAGAGDHLAIDTPNGTPISAQISSISSTGLTILVDSSQWSFRKWIDQDDPLPRYKGDHTAWTVV